MKRFYWMIWIPWVSSLSQELFGSMHVFNYLILNRHLYSLPDALLTRNGTLQCAQDMYYMETLWPQLLEQSPFIYPPVSNSQSKAYFHVVPQYSTCLYHDCVFEQNQSPDTCKSMTGDYVSDILDAIQASHPYWNASSGTDHIFIFPWDQASEILGWNHPVRKRLQNAIHFTNLGSLGVTDNFNPHKDIVIPPFGNASVALKLYPDPQSFKCNIKSRLSSLLSAFESIGKGSFTSIILNSELVRGCQPKSPRYTKWASRSRSTWAYFRGTIMEDYKYSFGVRQKLRELGSRSPQFQIHEGHSQRYWQELGDATFSLCPSGWSPWSPRLFDSILTGSIPVIFADDTRLPFESLVNYRDFAIKIRNDHVDQLEDILKSMSLNQIQSKRNEMLKIRHLFVWNNPPQEGDAFYATIQMLSRKKSHVPTGHDEFS